MRRRFASGLALTAILGLAIAGCGGNGDDEDTDTNSTAAGGGELFSQTSHTGTLTPIQGKDDVFTLTLDDPSPDVTSFTDRPIRSATTEPLPDFVASWDQRGFGDDPPNAALVLDQEADNADTAIFTLADPKYDQAGGSVSYTATHVRGGTASLPSDEDIDPPPKFGDAHLFIDPSGTGAPVSLAIDLRSSKQSSITLTFNPPWTPIVGTGDSGIGYIVGGTVGGGGELITNKVSLKNNGSLEFAVAGGDCPITGTAQVTSGISAQIQVGDGPEQPLKTGPVSLAC